MKEDILSHKDLVWLIFTPTPNGRRFSPLVSCIDWYNNQLFAKAYKDQKVNFKSGEKTLFQVTPLIQASHLVTIGVEGLTAGKKTAELAQIAEDLYKDLAPKGPSAWIVISESISENLRDDLKSKLKNHFDDITVG